MLLILILKLLFLASGQCKEDSSCRRKSYSVPCIQPTVCSHLEVTISVDEFEDGVYYHNTTLIAYNMEPSKTHGVGFVLVGQEKNLAYSCVKLNSDGTLAKVQAGIHPHAFGSSIYMNGNLICTWIAEPFSSRPSLYDTDILELIYDGNYNLLLGLDTFKSLAAQNSTELPWYQMGFTKCGGYKVYGNDKYQLIAKKRTNAVQFWINPLKGIPNISLVSLIHEKSSSLIILCNYTDGHAFGLGLSSNKPMEALEVTDSRHESKIFGGLCSVVLSDRFECRLGFCSIWNSTFELSIVDDRKGIIYRLTDLNLSKANSGSTSLSGLTIVLPFMPFLVLIIKTNEF